MWYVSAFVSRLYVSLLPLLFSRGVQYVLWFWTELTIANGRMLTWQRGQASHTQLYGMFRRTNFIGDIVAEACMGTLLRWWYLNPPLGRLCLLKLCWLATIQRPQSSFWLRSVPSIKWVSMRRCPLVLGVNLFLSLFQVSRRRSTDESNWWLTTTVHGHLLEQTSQECTSRRSTQQGQ